MATQQIYVLLVFDGLHVLIPQHEIQSVEIIADVHITPMQTGAIGWFTHGHEQESLIYCLSEELTLLLDLPNNREFFVLFKSSAEDISIGLACDEVETLSVKDDHLYLQELPIAMKLPGSPISQLVRYQEKMGCICEGEVLKQYIFRLSENFVKG